MIPFYVITYLFLLFLAIIVYFANRADQRQQHIRFVIYALNFVILLIFALELMVMVSTLASVQTAAEGYDPMQAKLFVVISTAVVGISLLIVNYEPARLTLEKWLGSERARRIGAREPLYDSNSAVHNTAIVLALAWITLGAFGFLEAGGLEGMAGEYEQVETQNEPAGDVLPLLAQDLLLNVGFALLGVGLFLRRSLREALKRLGLRRPTRREFLLGIGIGLAMYGAVFIAGIYEYWYTPADAYEVQSAASASAVAAYEGSILLWFLMSLVAGVGEEILFRGALQPVFGAFITSLVFMGLHTQYSFTFSWLVIFCGGLFLGWLRNRHSTTACIIAHTTYNFVPYIVTLLLAGSGG